MGDLPTSADQVDFSRPDGQLDSASPMAPAYQVTYEFPAGENVDLELALRAARAGIIYAGLDVVNVDTEQRAVIGHRAATLHWLDRRATEYAGIYLEKDEGRIRAKIYISGDTSVGWGSNPIGQLQMSIKTGMELFLKTELQVQQHSK